ncbi:MAG: L-threonylcarbamoyladenylate synthase [Pseudoclavibacter sp.]
MARIFDCEARDELLDGMRQARQAIARGDLIVMPTDTVYGVAADAFSPTAVGKLLAAKGRDRGVPSPVLVADTATFHALASVVPPQIEELLERFAPGPLTVILPARESLRWDLGNTGGTVALRVPDNDIARELLRETGPLAVSSANKHGEPAPETAARANDALGDDVALVLDAGRGGGAPSTIIDATGLTANPPTPARLVRDGALSRAELAEVLGGDLAPPAHGAFGEPGSE